LALDPAIRSSGRHGCGRLFHRSSRSDLEQQARRFANADPNSERYRVPLDIAFPVRDKFGFSLSNDFAKRGANQLICQPIAERIRCRGRWLGRQKAGNPLKIGD
jgi:hypothetical protein